MINGNVVIVALIKCISQFYMSQSLPTNIMIWSCDSFIMAYGRQPNCTPFRSSGVSWLNCFRWYSRCVSASVEDLPLKLFWSSIRDCRLQTSSFAIDETIGFRWIDLEVAAAATIPHVLQSEMRVRVCVCGFATLYACDERVFTNCRRPINLHLHCVFIALAVWPIGSGIRFHVLGQQKATP